MAIISFNGRVNIGIRIVSEKYPQAKLYEATGWIIGGSTTTPTDLEHLRVVFQNENNTTVIIKETGYGEFGEPELINEPWLGDVVIEWPIKMDLDKANDLKEKAGFEGAYYAVTLRNPLGPVKKNPLFIFGMESSADFVFVDTVTGEVSSGK